jgi:ribosomal protein L37E
MLLSSARPEAEGERAQELGDSVPVLPMFAMHYERVVLGPRYALRLEDLQAMDALQVECVHCGWPALVALHRLHDRFAASERLSGIAATMRCRRCGRRGAVDWLVLRASPPKP